MGSGSTASFAFLPPSFGSMVVSLVLGAFVALRFGSGDNGDGSCGVGSTISGFLVAVAFVASSLALMDSTLAFDPSVVTDGFESRSVEGGFLVGPLTLEICVSNNDRFDLEYVLGASGVNAGGLIPLVDAVIGPFGSAGTEVDFTFDSCVSSNARFDSLYVLGASGVKEGGLILLDAAAIGPFGSTVTSVDFTFDSCVSSSERFDFEYILGSSGVNGGGLILLDAAVIGPFGSAGD